MSDWRPMSGHVFPWEHRHLIVMAFAADEPTEIEIFRCRCAEHGALFPENTSMLTIIEQGWVPYAWCVDESPARDDEKFPPMWRDYLIDRTPK